MLRNLFLLLVLAICSNCQIEGIDKCSQSENFTNNISHLFDDNYFNKLSGKTVFEVQASFLSAVTESSLKNNFTYDASCMLSSLYVKICQQKETFAKPKQVGIFCDAFVDNLDHTKANKTANPSQNIWFYSFLSVTGVSICSLIGIAVLPLMHKAYYNKVLLFLIALAAGTLAGNAVFQLIPEGFGVYEDPNTIWLSSIIAFGIYLFFFVENLLEIVFKQKNKTNLKVIQYSPEVTENDPEDTENGISIIETSADTLLQQKPVNKLQILKDAFSSEDLVHTTYWEKFTDFKRVKPIAWMITVGDGLHNFIDGLAIGTSFVISPIQGFSTSFAIFCEEFPTELGDFAILLKAGMTVSQAAFFNFVSACSCYLGMIVGVVVGQQLASATWIFALAGGVFMYISLSAMLPEARDLSAGPQLASKPWFCFFLQSCGMFVGLFAMFLLTFFKDEITFV